MKSIGVIELFIRLGVFAAVIAVYLITGDVASIVLNTPFFGQFTAVHTAWLILLAGMVIQLIPSRRIFVSNSKQFEQLYTPPKQGYDPRRLMQEAQKMNAGARNVLIFWLTINVVLAVLYFAGILGANAVILVVMVYYLCDVFCMLIWCPLQKIFMKSRCCVDCRIYGWGYFLVFGPLLLLPGFFTISLAAFAIALLIRWEVSYALHPERFWSGSNILLHCQNCTTRHCELKRQIARRVNTRIPN